MGVGSFGRPRFRPLHPKTSWRGPCLQYLQHAASTIALNVSGFAADTEVVLQTGVGWNIVSFYSKGNPPTGTSGGHKRAGASGTFMSLCRKHEPYRKVFFAFFFYPTRHREAIQVRSLIRGVNRDFTRGRGARCPTGKTPPPPPTDNWQTLAINLWCQGLVIPRFVLQT